MLRAAIGRVEREGISPLVGSLFRAPQDFREEEAIEVRHYYGNRAAASWFPALGWFIPQLLHSLFYAGTRLGADLDMAV